jgi:excinuclease ABC subunit C
MTRVLLDEQIADAPKTPGCYVMKDEGGEILYVGKAKNIRLRIQSYFRGKIENPKTHVLVSKVRALEFLKTDTEIEALLLENTLIKKHRPRYNIRLKDDKTYPYLWIDTSHDFPRAYYARKARANAGLYFGPYPNPYALRQLLNLASKAFLIRDCRDTEFANRSRPCLSYQIGQCTAPCVGYVEKQKYSKQISDFIAFLKGENLSLKQEWEKEMEHHSEELHFEEAAKIRDRLKALEDLQAEQRAVDLNDQKSRDVWAYWPADFFKNPQKESDLDLVLLQFREGKWWGRKHFPILVEESFIDEEEFITLISSYYSKAEIPAEVVISPEFSDDQRGLLSEFLKKLNEERQSLPFAFEKINAPDSGERLWKLWDLALSNARSIGEEQSQLREKRRDSVELLRKFLKLDNKLNRIECLDISNFQGSENVAAVVVFQAGKKQSAEYRNYIIKGIEGQDDFGSLREVVRRRYGKVDSPRPDLLIVDGGKAQLESVLVAMKEVGVHFPVVGLAKARTERSFKSQKVESSEERIFLPGVKLSKAVKNLEILRLVTEVRDEAHRFAISFHRKRRDQIPR